MGRGLAAARVNRPRPDTDVAPAAVVLGGAAAAAGFSALERRRRPRSSKAELAERIRAASGLPTDRSARRKLSAAAGLMAGAVLADSAMEHYRGSFKNPGMFLPLISSSLCILASADGLLRGERPGRARTGVFAAAAALGVVGLGFHAFNIAKRPGQLSWLNLFYGAPYAAPGALTLAGALGLGAERLASPDAGRRERVMGIPLGRALAGLTSFGLVGTVSEVLLYHFRGAFQDPFMWAPATLPPVAAGLMAKAAAAPSAGRSWVTRGWLWLTGFLGLVGMGFHAFGVARNMGGWGNWRQNLLAGPPLPAPPSFTALALAAAVALDLTEREALRR